MIDEHRTLELYGYYSTELKPQSNKPIVVVCEECGKYRISRKYSYRELCLSCACGTEECRSAISDSMKGHNLSDAHKKNISMSLKGRKVSVETRLKLSKAHKGKTLSDEHRRKLSKAHKGIQAGTDHPNFGIPRTEQQKRNMSAGHPGIHIDDWDGYATEQKYCHKFNATCRENNRLKYGNVCFLCGKNEEDNRQKLCVHHIDMDKQQGCNDRDWKLVPLCRTCHGHVHSKIWQSRIEYLLRR